MASPPVTASAINGFYLTIDAVASASANRRVGFYDAVVGSGSLVATGSDSGVLYTVVVIDPRLYQTLLLTYAPIDFNPSGAMDPCTGSFGPPGSSSFSGAFDSGALCHP